MLRITLKMNYQTMRLYGPENEVDELGEDIS